MRKAKSGTWAKWHVSSVAPILSFSRHNSYCRAGRESSAAGERRAFAAWCEYVPLPYARKASWMEYAQEARSCKLKKAYLQWQLHIFLVNHSHSRHISPFTLEMSSICKLHGASIYSHNEMTRLVYMYLFVYPARSGSLTHTHTSKKIKDVRKKRKEKKGKKKIQCNNVLCVFCAQCACTLMKLVIPNFIQCRMQKVRMRFQSGGQYFEILIIQVVNPPFHPKEKQQGKKENRIESRKQVVGCVV